MSTIGIEALLRWAYVFELTKGDYSSDGPAGSASAWAIVERIGELGTMVDTFGGPLGHGDDPHPDAVVIAEAVAALDEMVVSEGDAHDLMAGWPDFGEAGDAVIARAWDITTLVDDGERRLRSSLASLVQRAAILNEWPDWRCDQPALTLACGREGKPKWFRVIRCEVEWTLDGAPIRHSEVEVDGYDRVRGRPHKGAYRKSILVPDPAAALAKRIEYGLTHAAVRQLAAQLDGLGGRRVLPPTASPLPWGDLEVAKNVA